MEYATAYDVGERKRDRGINEDSVAVSVFEQGHRDGLQGRHRRETSHSGADSDDELAGESFGYQPPTNQSGAVFALADGAGGHDAGDVASYIATTVILRELASVAAETARSDPDVFGVNLPSSPDPLSEDLLRAAVEEAIVTAHRTILDTAAESGTAAYTTVVAGIVANGKVHYGWVGDSRAYVVNRERETIAQLTRDHAVVERLRQDGEIDDVAAKIHPRGNEITRAVGGAGGGEEATVAVETGTVPLYAEDVLLVTSDGLVDAQTDAPALYDQYVESGRSDEMAETVRERAVTDDELREQVLDRSDLDTAAKSLIQLANNRGGKDNLSVILLSDPALEPTPEDENLAVRDVSVTAIEDRETVLLPDD